MDDDSFAVEISGKEVSLSFEWKVHKSLHNKLLVYKTQEERDR